MSRRQQVQQVPQYTDNINTGYIDGADGTGVLAPAPISHLAQAVGITQANRDVRDDVDHPAPVAPKTRNTRRPAANGAAFVPNFQQPQLVAQPQLQQPQLQAQPQQLLQPTYAPLPAPAVDAAVAPAPGKSKRKAAPRVKAAPAPVAAVETVPVVMEPQYTDVTAQSVAPAAQPAKAKRAKAGTGKGKAPKAEPQQAPLPQQLDNNVADFVGAATTAAVVPQPPATKAKRSTSKTPGAKAGKRGKATAAPAAEILQAPPAEILQAPAVEYVQHDVQPPAAAPLKRPRASRTKAAAPVHAEDQSYSHIPQPYVPSQVPQQYAQPQNFAPVNYQ